MIEANYYCGVVGLFLFLINADSIALVDSKSNYYEDEHPAFN